MIAKPDNVASLITIKACFTPDGEFTCGVPGKEEEVCPFLGLSRGTINICNLSMEPIDTVGDDNLGLLIPVPSCPFRLDYYLSKRMTKQDSSLRCPTCGQITERLLMPEHLEDYEGYVDCKHCGERLRIILEVFATED